MVRGVALLAAACGAGSGAEDGLVLRGRVIDGTGAPPIEAGVVVVEGDRIRCAGAGDECPVSPGARTLEVEDGTILPGLIDLHVHARPHYLQMWLAAGVTSVRDANNTIATIRAMQAVGPPRPRLFWAGPLLTGPAGALAELPSAAGPEDGPIDEMMPLVIPGAEAGGAAVDSLAARGAPVAKLYEHLSLKAFQAIVERAADRGLASMGDIGMMLTGGLSGTEVDALQAMETGLGTLEHMSGFALAYQRLAGDPTAERLDSDRVDRLARAVLESSTVMVPTLISVLQFATDSVSLEGVPLANRLHPVLSLGWAERHALPPAARQRAVADLRVARAVLRRLVELGDADLLAAGTDAPNPYVVPGGSLHQELELLVDVGLSPLEAIRAATSAAADVLGREDLGRIPPGGRADLVVVEGNPAADVRATRNVRALIVDGREVDREELLADVEAASDSLYERRVEQGEIPD